VKNSFDDLHLKLWVTGCL